MRPPAPPRSTIARAAGGLALAFLVAVSLAGASTAPAAAEVWPTPAPFLVGGPFAGVEPQALALWSNPALGAAGPRWSVGASYLEPFESAPLSRSEAALTVRPGAVALSFGAARFGLDDLSARAWALGVSGRAAEGRLLCGLALRRHERAERAAWASDLGLWIRPVDRLRVAAVARSAVRAGALDVAPETEWEIDAAWQEGAFSAALGLSRDAVGPLWSGLATRVDVGRLAVYTVLGRLAGGEARVALGLRVELPGRIAVSAGQEGGPLLPQSRAACAEWSPSPTPARSPVAPRAPAENVRTPAPPDSSKAAGADSLGAADLDSLLEAGARARARAEALGRMVDALGDGIFDDEAATVEQWLAERDAVGGEMAPVVAPRAREPAGAGPREPAGIGPRGAARVTATGTATVGGQAWRAHGLGGAVAGELAVARRRGWLAALRASASRDPGEPAALDEARVSLTLAHARIARVIVGAFDATLGDGLVGVAPGPRLGESRIGAGAWRLGSAARPGRPGLPAAWGAAAEFHAGRALSGVLFRGRTPRDARPLAQGLWPTGGRYHRTALELGRRAAMAERLWGAGLEWRRRGSEARLALCFATAEYGGAAPRLLPDGSLLAHGSWLSVSGELPLPGAAAQAQVGGAWTAGPRGSRAHELRLRWRAPRLGGGSGRLVWQRKGDGFAPAAASPSIAPRSLLHARWLSPRSRLGGALWLGLEAEEWVSPPGATSPGRRSWSREVLVGLGARRASATGSLEVSRGATWREPGAGAHEIGQAVPGLVSAPWRVALSADWSPPRSALTVGLAHVRRRVSAAWRENWEIACATRPGRRASARLAVEVRPGTAGPPSLDPRLDPDPLGGTLFSSSQTSSRVTADFRFPLGTTMTPRMIRPRSASPAQGRLLARCIASSGNTRFELWFTATRGAPAAE